jgi:integrase
MNQRACAFRTVRRPKGVSSRYSLIVVDEDERPHLPLTRFYYETLQALCEGTTRTYLNTLLPYFTYVATDDWRQRRGDRWDSEPEAVQESVRDYLVHTLRCKVRRHTTYELVSLTAQSPNTVRVFLSALKQFYHVMQRAGWYRQAHPLADPVAQLMREIDGVNSFPRLSRPQMPSASSVEAPRQRRSSENYFRLVEDDWVPHPIDDPELHKQLLAGCKAARLNLRDQIVIRIAYESGARIREILCLTVGDWRSRGFNQEAMAFSKGSRGRKIKVIHFSSETAKMLREYVNTARRVLDQQQRRLEKLEDTDPLFLSQRRHPYDYEAFKPHWYKLCRILQIDLNIHGLRHWHVTQAMRLIDETASGAEEIPLRKEELVRYMSWRSPETLNAYEHYFQAQNHARTHEQLLQRLYAQDTRYREERAKASTREIYRQPPTLPKQGTDHPARESIEEGWTTLLRLGGM